MEELIKRLQRMASGAAGKPICGEAVYALKEQQARIAELEAELEGERMRLAACGVVALSNTPDSAKTARDMHPDYRSASCDDVARMVDESITLREQGAAHDAEVRKATLLEAAIIAETPIYGEQDDITMEAKDRVAKIFRRMAEGEK